MRVLRAQYFLSFAVMGSVAPFVAVYFKRLLGLNETQIGYILAASSIAVIASPILVTFLADTHLDARRLTAGAFALTAATLLIMVYARGFWPVLITYLFHTLAYTPLISLQDGITFCIQKKYREQLSAELPYHSIRVWGTIGFIVPGLILYALLRANLSIQVAMVLGAAAAVVGAINALSLPEVQLPDRQHGGASGMPTLGAVRTMLRPPLFVFCLAMFLLYTASIPYGSFFPLYLTDRVGLDDRWIGPITNIGVTVEVFFILAYGWLVRRLGVRALVILGAVGITIRLALLAAFPGVTASIATQLFHGLAVVGIVVLPAVYLNDHAEDRYRHSMQGVFQVFIVGLSRIAGSLMAGPIVRRSLTNLYWCAAALALLAVFLLVVAFVEEKHPAPIAAGVDLPPGTPIGESP